MPMRNPARRVGGSARNGSPDLTAKACAASATLAAIGPTWSRLVDSGCTPSRGTASKVGLKPTTPQHDAGMRIDPAVSVPTAIGTIPAATAAAEPPLDPPGSRSGAHGLTTAPKCGLSLVMP